MRRNASQTVISVVLVALTLVACGGSTEPPHFGVFIKADKQLIETAQFNGPPSTADIPEAANSQPTIVVWLQDLVLDYIVIRDNLGAGDVIAFTAKPIGNGIVELQAKSPLKDGAYCLVKGDPLASPFDVPYYCFRVGDAAAAGTVAPISAGPQTPNPITAIPTSISTPTPDPSARQTAVAAAATQLVNPSNVATQAAAVQVIEEATAVAVASTATAVAGDMVRLHAKANAWEAIQEAGRDCTSRVRSKIEAGDYSEIHANANLAGCDLSELNLFGLDFSGVNLSYANLQGANLKDAKFDADSNLERTDLRDANLEGVDLSEARTRLAIFSVPLPPTVKGESVVRNLFSVQPDSMFGHVSNPEALVWVPVKGRIFWGSDLYDLESGTRIEAVRWSNRYPPVFSPDGKLMGTEDGVCLVDDGECLFYQGYIHLIGWTPDGAAALIQESDRITLWNPTTDETLVSINGAFSGVLSPDGSQIAVSQEEGITLWNTRTSAKDKMLLPGVQATNLVYSPDGQWLVLWEQGDYWSEESSQLRVVNIDSSEIVLEQIRPKNVIHTVSWSPSRSQLIMTELGNPTDGVSCFSKLSVWNIGSVPNVAWEKTSQCGSLVEFVLDPQGEWIALNIHLRPGSANFRLLTLMNVNDGTELSAEFYMDEIDSIASSPDGKYLAVSLYDSLRLFPVQALLSP